MDKKLDTSSYKGVRDFYPEDMFVENYIFSTMRRTVESFGYLEYGASPLEPAEIYKAKSGEEIVNEQTYTFTDRGGRDVTLRPEMTPTLARMIAGRQRELPTPTRWYSIPNLFRYEQPQKGRLREHYQLNADIFGVDSSDAEVEIILLANEIMKNFGAKESDFEIRINSRKMTNDLFASFGLDEEKIRTLSKVLDKKNKIRFDIFEESVKAILGEKSEEFIRVMEVNQRILDRLGSDNQNVSNLSSLIDKLSQAGLKNVFFDASLMRGFDYYTDIVFEIFDTDKDNNRSLFGGGRYNNLTELFGENPIPAVGFGMGDVTIKNFLESRGLIPEYRSTTDIYICKAKGITNTDVVELALKIREEGLNVATDLSDKKIGDQIKTADKMKIPFVLCYGEEEKNTGEFKVKNLGTGEEKTLKKDGISEFVKAD